ncbi:MAG: PHP domain-containing protein [Sphaerochaetaceae bacterium]
MKELCDLHAHTTVSDGSFSPSELIAYAKQKQAKALAITDHDTIDGLDEAAECARAIDQEFIPGIEITTNREECEIHIIGLFIDYHEKKFANAVKEMSKTRDKRNWDMVEKLMQAGFAISHADLDRYKECIVTKAHIGEILVERGYAHDVTEAMNTFLRKGGVAFVQRVTPSPLDCINLVHQAGGLAFVAHINQIDKKQPEHGIALCRYLLEQGADGLETRYCEFDDYWRAISEALAVEYGCLRSGGSDFHGTFKKGLDLVSGYGDLEVPYEYVKAMQRKLAGN